MKLTEPDLKIKCKASHLNTLLEYLREIIENHNEYLETFIHNSTVRRIYRHNLSTLCEKVAKCVFNYININPNGKEISLKLNYAERITLSSVVDHYPLPMEINFIEYEIKNKLII